MSKPSRRHRTARTAARAPTPSATQVAFELFQQREQMDRLSCYQERDGDWTFPKWANTDELKAQTMAICLKNATEEEKASLFKQMDDADAKAEADKLVDDVYA